MSATTADYTSKRRSTRIRAQIPIRVSSLDAPPHFSEHCHTLVVNPQGCGVRLRRALEPGYRVALDELPKGIGTTATVVSCVPVGSDGKFFLIGLALENPGNVWSINPAPADWNTEPQPVPAAASPKSAQWPYSIFSDKGEAHPGRK
jgi:hypothetical protein